MSWCDLTRRASNRRTGFGLFLLIAGTGLMMLISSCGYHFTKVGGAVPVTSKTIAIPVFINDTYEPYVDTDVTSAVIEEFLSDGRLKVVGPETADLVLRGRVSNVTLTPQTYDTNQYVQYVTVAIEVKITLMENGTGKVLLNDQGVGSVFTSSYYIDVNNIATSKINKEAAIQKAAKDIASSIRSRVLDCF